MKKRHQVAIETLAKEIEFLQVANKALSKQLKDEKQSSFHWYREHEKLKNQIEESKEMEEKLKELE